LIAIRLDDKDELKWVNKTTGDNDVIISTSAGQAIRFNEKDARPMGRTARGVRGIRLRPNDIVVGMDIVNEKLNLLVISKNGYGKRTKVANFPSHRRGGVGIKAAVVTAKTGNLTTVKSLGENSKEMIAISDKGQTIRISLAEIPMLGRTTQGVRIMRLNDGDIVSSVAIVDEEPETEETENIEKEPKPKKTSSDSKASKGAKKEKK
jgi:DNA gyrase subunit A